MAQTDPASIAKRLQAADLPLHMKNRLLFELPKMDTWKLELLERTLSSNEIRHNPWELYDRLFPDDMEKETSLDTLIREEKTQEESSGLELERLKQEIERSGGVTAEEALDPLKVQAFFGELAQDKRKAFAFLMALGPSGMLELDNVLASMEKGKPGIPLEEIKVMRRELRMFRTKVYELEKEFERKKEKIVEEEELKAELHKQKILKKALGKAKAFRKKSMPYHQLHE